LNDRPHVETIRDVALEVRVDPDLCVGTGDCWRLAPVAFQLDEARGVSVVRPGAEAVARDVLDEAAFNCPTRAITIGEPR
jgi:ferredoxin